MSKWIRNSKQVKQSIDFYGIGNDKIHPTDIDAVLEFNNEALILFEVKQYSIAFKGNLESFFILEKRSS